MKVEQFLYTHRMFVCVCLPALQSGQQSTSVNHQWTKEAVYPIDSEKGLFNLPEFILVTTANELRLDLFQLLAMDPTSPQKSYLTLAAEEVLKLC